jgi:hypothetical protein
MYIAIYATDDFDDQEKFETVLDSLSAKAPLMLIDNDTIINTFMMVYSWARRRTCEYVTVNEAMENAFEFIIFTGSCACKTADKTIRTIVANMGKDRCKIVTSEYKRGKV